jgi:hypothetical protein
MRIDPHMQIVRLTVGLLGVLIAVLASNCASLQPSAPAASNLTQITLPITPRPDGRLCWDSSSLGGRTWAEVREGPPLMSSGLGTGIAEGDISDSAFLGVHTFLVKPNIPLTAKLHVWYPRTELNTSPLNLRYLILLDERALAGAIPPSTGSYHDLTLQPEDEITLTLKIPPLSPGIHDLIAVGLANPTNEPDPYGIIESHALRTTIVAGSGTQSLSRSFDHLPADGSITRGAANIPLMLGQAGGPLKVWNWPQTRLPVRLGKPVEFTIYAGYEGPGIVGGRQPLQPEDIQFALLTFLDYRQVDVALGVPVLYGEVSRDTAYTRIAARLPPPGESGRHDILVVRINYPRIPMCVLNGPPDGQTFPSQMEVSRVAIDGSVKD